MKIWSLLIFIVFTYSATYSQINGAVYDNISKTPLSNAHVRTDTDFAATNYRGIFTLNANAKIIVISHIGYITDTLIIADLPPFLQVYLEPNYNNLDQIIIQAPQQHHKLMNLPSSANIILLNNESNNIGYVNKLNEAPGIFVHSGTLNTTRITIRGMGSRTPYGSNRIKAYFNGIPITSGDGSTEIEDIDPQSIKTIDILKGSKSGMYGSGLGGVLLLTSPKPYKDGLHGNVHMMAGSFSTLNPNLNISYKKDKLSLLTQYAYSTSDGWRQNNTYQRHNFSTIAGYATEKSSFEFLLQYISTNAQIPSSLNQNTFEHAPDSAAQNWLNVNGYEKYDKLLIGLNYKQELGAHFNNTIIGYSNSYSGYEVRPFNILDDDALKMGVKNTLQYNIENFNLFAGFEALLEQYNWSIFEINNAIQGPEQNRFSEKRIPLNIFLSSSINLKNGILVDLGLSYNFLQYELTDHLKDDQDLSGNYSYKPILSPFAGINIPLFTHWNYYASLSHGFSAPSVEETLFPDGTLNTNIKPETGINAESGFRYANPKGSFFIDAGIYKIWLSNLLLVQRESEDVFYAINAGKTEHSGLELSTNLLINKTAHGFLPKTKVNASYTNSLHKFSSYISNGIDYKGKHLPGIPKQNLWLATEFSYESGLFLHYQLQYTGLQYLNDANSGTYEAFLLNNASMGYKIAKTFELSFAIKNLFNTHYASMILVNAPSFGANLPRYYYPGMPRNYSLTFTYKF